jgi:hypothetical protein
MNKLEYTFYSSKLWTPTLRITGRVPAGFHVGWGRWMTLTDAQMQVGPGWGWIVAWGFHRCLKNGWRIYQIKEKYGTLRFYADGNMDDIEIRSECVCEECGRPGKLRNTGWWKTLCDKCAEPETRLRRRERSWQ